MKILVVYFSSTGKTEAAAKAITGFYDGEIRKIEEIRINRRSISGFIRSGFEAAAGVNSDIKPMNLNLKGYDRVFIGSPLWAGKPAPAVNSFIEEAEFKKIKTMLFFTGAAGSSGKAEKILRDKIEKKGGKIEGNIFVNSRRKSAEMIEEEVRKILSK